MVRNFVARISRLTRLAGAALIEPLVVVILMVVSTTAIAQPFYIPSGSMEPTLAIGDYLFATKYSYGYSRYSMPFGFGPSSEEWLWGRIPERGDVVVFREPIKPKVNLVKRVIGLPGDRVVMRNGRLFLKGKVVPEKYMGESQVEFGDGHFEAVGSYPETLPGAAPHLIYKVRQGSPLDNTPEFRVPPAHFFAMGDNRDDSLDSRVAGSEGGVGYVPFENLVGKARLVVASYDFLNGGSTANWLKALRTNRILTQVD